MARRQVIIIAAMGVSIALAGLSFSGRGDAGVPPVQGNSTPGTLTPRGFDAPPDTRAENWKSLSPDVGLQLTRDARLGLRARVFVRLKGGWVPVAIDGPADLAGIVPAN